MIASKQPCIMQVVMMSCDFIASSICWYPLHSKGYQHDYLTPKMVIFCGVIRNYLTSPSTFHKISEAHASQH